MNKIYIESLAVKEFLTYFSLFLVFSSGQYLDFTWRFGWLLLAATSFAFLYVYTINFIKKQLLDRFLFLVGVIVFLVLNPLFAIFQSGEFPSIYGNISSNYIGNKTGAIVALFASSFYLGRMLFYKKFKILKPRVEQTKIHLGLLFLFFMMSIIPFFSGYEFSLSNFLMNISGRENTHVAFSQASVANSRPIILLLVQTIPVSIILSVMYIASKPNIIRFFFIGLPALFFLYLYVSMGGRSAILLPILSIVIYYSFVVKKIINSKFLFTGLAVFLLLSYQVNSRLVSGDTNPFTGYDLNREVAHIAEHYGEDKELLNGDNILLNVVQPLTDTIVFVISNPIPRIVWNEKPIDPSFAEYNFFRLGHTGLGTGSNITPTIPGRYYLNYGLSGVFVIGFFIGFIWRATNTYINRNFLITGLPLLIPIVLSVTIFLVFRDLAPGRFYPFLWLIIFNFLNKFIHRIQKC
jgi:oligosaccharide repeat unit polymerase